MKTALLISTYNWPEALELVLNSVEKQSVLPDEILIADDGSDNYTKEVIEKFVIRSKVPVLHIWQEDQGFRKAKILNKAVSRSTADYIIQIDGDIILHPYFIEDHKNRAEENCYLYGSRVNILPQAVARILGGKLIGFHFFSSEIKNRSRTLHIPFFAKFYKKHEGISRKYRGCNTSYWKKDFMKINGYNEAFEGWGREDSDLAIRLGNAGVFAKRLKFAGIAFHIYHKVSSKGHVDKNNQLQDNSIHQKMTRCEHGVHQYLNN